MENKELLNKIKVYRAMKNISQEELAVAIGVTRKTINTVETGKFIPSTVLCAEDSTLFRGSGGRNFCVE
ncbi:helix-turn-helix domain-containing protein [Bacteroides thetaiotaomicron]|nr:helix-turn-helix domain-containing protein [Bacteroides thetaiotaomicron]